MPDFLVSVKTFFVVILTSASTLVAPANPVQSPMPNPQTNPAFIKLASDSAARAQNQQQPTNINNSQQNSNQPENTPLPLNGDNYIFVSGTYSYLGNSVKYLALIPRKGGSFSTAINGACEAQGGGNYEGGEGGRVTGTVGGECNVFGQKVKGSTHFKGKLYTETKVMEIDIDNSPIHSFNIKYN